MNKACDEAAHLLKAQRIVWCYLNVLQWWTKYAQENFVFRPEGKGCQNILVLLHETPSATTSFVVLKMIGYAIDALVNKISISQLMVIGHLNTFIVWQKIITVNHLDRIFRFSLSRKTLCLVFGLSLSDCRWTLTMQKRGSELRICKKKKESTQLLEENRGLSKDYISTMAIFILSQILQKWYQGGNFLTLKMLH